MKKLPLAAAFGALSVLGAVSASQVVLAQAETVEQTVLMAEGGPLYQRNCQGCHGAGGEGGAGERLIGSPVVGSVGGVVNQILLGAVEHGMPPFNRLSDREIAAISTYVRNSFTNAFGPVQPSEVTAIRAAAAGAGG
ncbi:MAG: c-type cytochrome [Bauldia sp.]|jgi:mono/diheme cytochrome c family protein